MDGIAGIAGKRDDIHQRQFEHPLGGQCFIKIPGDRRVLAGGTQVQSASQTDPLRNDGAFLKHALPIGSDFPLDDTVGKLVYLIKLAAEGQFSHLFKYLPSKIGNRSENSSHPLYSFLSL